MKVLLITTLTVKHIKPLEWCGFQRFLFMMEKKKRKQN